MDPIAEIPQPSPEIPKGKLWTALLMPPVVTVVGGLIALAVAQDHGEELLLVLPVSLVAILIGAVLFVPTWGVRYRGRSLVLTTIGYILGQIILCLVLWFGCCLTL